MNPLSREPKILKSQVREFVKKIEKELNRVGGRCKLSAVIRPHEGTHYTLVSFRPESEIEYAPLAMVKTIDIFDDPVKARNEITSQLHYALKKIAERVKQLARQAA